MTTAAMSLVNASTSTMAPQNGTKATQYEDDIIIANADMMYEEMIRAWLAAQNVLADPGILDSSTDSSDLTSNLPWNKNSTMLCGFPGFCHLEAYGQCFNTPMNQCNQCYVGAANFLIFFCILVGFLILLGNTVVIIVSSRQKPPDTFGKIKISLAVADLLVGLQVLIMSPYNMSWTLQSTAMQIEQHQKSVRGSTRAILGGSFFLFTFTSSLYHLIYLGAERLCAIRWPFVYRKQKAHHVIVALGVVWVWSALSATVPLWFPNDLVFTYYHTLFAYFFAQKDVAQPKRVAVVSALTAFYVLPLILMTLVCVLMAFTAYERFGGSSNVASRSSQQMSEKRIYRVVALMQLGFLLTQLPFVICYSLFYGKTLRCSNFSDPFLITFYISVLNSLVNVVVYSIVDPKFRVALKQSFGCHVAKKNSANQKTPNFSNRIIVKYKPSTSKTSA